MLILAVSWSKSLPLSNSREGGTYSGLISWRNLIKKGFLIIESEILQDINARIRAWVIEAAFWGDMSSWSNQSVISRYSAWTFLFFLFSDKRTAVSSSSPKSWDIIKSK